MVGLELVCLYTCIFTSGHNNNVYLLTPLVLFFFCQYPLTAFVRILAFDGEQEAENFCQHHGIRVEAGHVVMDKSRFIQPESAFGITRAINIVESKMVGSVGEV